MAGFVFEFFTELYVSLAKVDVNYYANFYITKMNERTLSIEWLRTQAIEKNEMADYCCKRKSPNGFE